MTSRAELGTRPFGYRRPGAERARRNAVDAARVDSRARVLMLHGDRVLIGTDGRAKWHTPADVATAAEWALLGSFAGGAPALLALVSDEQAASYAEPEDWQSVRRVAHGLDEDDAAAAVTAVSLGRWLTDASFCPACGSRTDVEDSGWSRRCPSCRRQHFPRTDPAVIVAVTSATNPDRLLLGNNALWEPNRFSCFAGFVEAGESAEDAVRRELSEECGIRVHTMRYRGSQAWPFPRSFMLGFLAQGIDDNDARADGEEIRTVRWFSRDELRAAFRGDSDIVLPGAASISHALIRGWCDGE